MKRDEWTIDGAPWRTYVRWCCEAWGLIALCGLAGRAVEALAVWWGR